MTYNLDNIITDELYEGGDKYHVNFDEKPVESYSKALKGNIKLLSLRPGKAKIFGSYDYKASLYPGDIDLSEEVIYKGKLDTLLLRVQAHLKDLVNRINDTKEHWVTEIKCGLDERFMVDIGYWKYGLLYDYKPVEVYHHISLLRAENLITNDEYLMLLKLTKDIDIDKWDELYEFFRQEFVIRWTPEEFLHGSKYLKGHKIITFHEALSHKTMVKIDVVLALQGKYIEMSNFFLIQHEQKNGDHVFVNLPQDFIEKFRENVKHEIEKLFFNAQFTNYFKMSKRIFSLARNMQNKKVGRDMLGLLNSDAGLLYTVKSDLDTIILMLEKIKNAPMISIMKMLDNTKNRIANVTQIKIEKDGEEIDYFKTVNKLVSNHKRLKRITIIYNITFLKKAVMESINRYSKRYLIQHKYIPLDYKWLPKDRKYV